MSDTQKPVSTAQAGDDLVGAAENFGHNLARVSAAVVSLPFYLLPQQTRTEAIDATTDLFVAVGDLHLNLVRAAVSRFGVAARELTRTVGEPAPRASKTVTRVPVETASPPAPARR